jgi:hypothetical protein
MQMSRRSKPWLLLALGVSLQAPTMCNVGWSPLAMLLLNVDYCMLSPVMVLVAGASSSLGTSRDNHLLLIGRAPVDFH